MRLRHWIHAATTTALVAGLVAVVPAATVAHAAPSLPAGFLLDDIPTGMAPGFQGDFLTDFAFLPDESMLVSGKYGKINWVPRTGTPRTIANVPVVGTEDMGLQGIAVAPDYATSRTVYTTRTAPSNGPNSGNHGVLRLSRWTVTVDSANNPQGLTNEQTVVETSADAPVHGMSSVVADEDGTLWVSVGDSAKFIGVDQTALRALDVNDAHGKLLHVKQDGTGVASNPYFDPANPNAVRGKVYASGFRSPFRFSLDPKTKRPILGDVGWNTTEEVDLVNPGNEYGWPCWEGNERTVGFRDLPACAPVATVAPIWTYPRAAGSSVTGGVIYTGKNYPVEYQGRYFFGDYGTRRLWNMAFDTAGKVTVPPTDPGFGVDIGYVVKIAAMPTGGDIVFADIIGGTIRRLVYAPGNNPPVAVMSSTNDAATRTVTFNAEKSWDPNGDELEYTWDFGDGTTGTGKTAVHTYPASPASFTAKLTATDPLNKSGTDTSTVYPSNRAPALDLRAPDPDWRFAVGDVISATATATDPEDGAVEVSWTTDMVHCRGAGNCHSHPGERLEHDSEFNLTFEGHAGDTRLEITATAIDSKGAATSRTFIAKPKQRRVTVQSNYPAEFTIGDEQGTTGLFTVGQNLTIVAPETAADKVATFDKWAEGTNRVLTKVVPDADLTVNVTYLTPIDRRYNAEPALRQILDAASEVEQGDANVRWREYQGGRMYWSPETGAHAVFGMILDRYLNVGGHLGYGLPTTDELATPDNRGRYNLFTGSRSIYWTPQTGTRLVLGKIYDKWDQLGRDTYNGLPTTDELNTPDNVGRFNAFERGYIYWHPSIGTAYEIHGQIYSRWATLGWERSALGYPTSDENVARDNVGRFNEFQNGSIYWSPATDAWEVRGGIRAKWLALGGELSPLGYPITNESIPPDQTGRFNHFKKDGGEHSIYWHPSIGTAYEVLGAIRGRWRDIGWETSYLGYPTSDEFDIPGGRRTNFQGGYIIHMWGGPTTDHRY